MKNRAYRVNTSRGWFHFFSDNRELAKAHAEQLESCAEAVYMKRERRVYPETLEYVGWVEDLPCDDNPNW